MPRNCLCRAHEPGQRKAPLVKRSSGCPRDIHRGSRSTYAVGRVCRCADQALKHAHASDQSPDVDDAVLAASAALVGALIGGATTVIAGALQHSRDLKRRNEERAREREREPITMPKKTRWYLSHADFAQRNGVSTDAPSAD